TTRRGGRSVRHGPAPAEKARTSPVGEGRCAWRRLLHDRHGERPAGAPGGALGTALHPASGHQAHGLALPLRLVESLVHMGTSHGFGDELHLSGPVLARVVRATGGEVFGRGAGGLVSGRDHRGLLLGVVREGTVDRAGGVHAVTGFLRGRPRGRFRATTTPWTNSSPPQTPHGSRRSLAPARQAS